MMSEIPRLDILVLVLGENSQRLAGQVALADIRDRCVNHAGGCAGSALLVEGWQERDAERADGAERDDFRQVETRKKRLNGINSRGFRPYANNDAGVFGEDVREFAEILCVKRLGLVGNQLLDVKDIARRAKSKSGKVEEKEKEKLHLWWRIGEARRISMVQDVLLL